MIKIRASSLPSYSDCPRRSAASSFKWLVREAGYDLRERQHSIGAAVGTASHTAAIYNVKAIIEHGTPGTLADAIENGIIDYRKNAAGGILFDGTTVSNNEAERQIQTLGYYFYNDVLPKIQPAAAERYLPVVLGDGFMLTGHTDIESVSDDIDDLKFGSKMRPYHGQLGAYATIKQAHDKRETKQLKIWHMPRVSTKKQYPGTQKIVLDNELCIKSALSTIKRIKSDVTRFQATGDAWEFPANPMSMMCSDKYCPAWGTNFCDFGRKE